MNQIIKKPRVKLAFLNGIKSSCPLKKKKEKGPPKENVKKRAYLFTAWGLWVVLWDYKKLFGKPPFSRANELSNYGHFLLY